MNAVGTMVSIDANKIAPVFLNNTVLDKTHQIQIVLFSNQKNGNWSTFHVNALSHRG